MPGRSGGACTVTAQPHLVSGWAGLDGWCWRWLTCFSALLSFCPGQSHPSTWSTGIARDLFLGSWPAAELVTRVCWWSHLHLWPWAGWWLSTASLGTPLSALGSDPAEQVVLKLQFVSNRGRAVAWEPLFPLQWHWAASAAGAVCCSPPQSGHVGVLAAHPTSSPSPFSPALGHSLIYCWQLANVALSHALACRGLDGQPSYSSLGEMAWLGPSGTVAWGSQRGHQRGSSPIHVTPWKHQHGGFPKSPLFLRPKHLSADSRRLFGMLVPSQIL